MSFGAAGWGQFLAVQAAVKRLTATGILTITPAGLALIDDANATAQRVTLGLGSAATKELTSWVTYTPTFTGFGTVSGVSIWSRRVGDTLHIRGKFTSGVATGVEARMTLGSNGTNANVSSDATKVPSLQMAGACGLGGTVAVNALIESNIGYLTFARGNVDGMTKALANSFISTGVVLSVLAEVPISGW